MSNNPAPAPTSSNQLGLVKEEVFNKFLKLLNSGIIPTSAKNINGLEIGDLINLPLSGTNVYKYNKLNDSITKIENYDKIGTNNDTESNLRLFVNIVKKLKLLNLQLNRIPDESKKDNILTCLSLKGCTIIKDDTIFGYSDKIFNYNLNLSEFMDLDSEGNMEEIEQINTKIAEVERLIKLACYQTYAKKLTLSDYSEFPGLRALKPDIEPKVLYSGINSESPEYTSWFNNLFVDSELIIDYEFGLYNVITMDETGVNILDENG